ncbi:hypothetical protein QCE73_37360 [Caballeronia sp. LZ029]|uniref:hypothetical protein n=1 Tax=Caballeronia sp. LZ029 TaxID=3038564 RepID=UPI00285FFB35|nr:hypothetical protein [Caballeronia sp. LZ029]MDR5748851.1 hypothetical protein [Caballeronia sp. LZ029]
MKPAQIRVFDGLRLTSEHLEHLQQAMLSSVGDLREIAGANCVYRGLEVELTEGGVTVKPGLAFDAQKNRIVIDEPQTVVVDFGDNDLQRYVCAKYESVEDGEVESHFTIVWDSGSIVVRPTPPDASENMLLLAKVTRQADGTKQVLLDSVRRDTGATSSMGLETLASSDAGFDLRKSVLSQPSDVSKWEDVLFEREIEALEPVGTVRCFLEVSMVFQWIEESPAVPNAVPTTRKLVATSQGEACVHASGDPTHISTTTVRYSSEETEFLTSDCCVSQEGIAVVRLAPLVANFARSEPVPSALRPLLIVVRAERSGAGRFSVRGCLRFAIDAPTGRAEGLEKFTLITHWAVRLGWSA